MIQPSILQVEDDENDAFLIRQLFKDTGIMNPIRVVTDGQMTMDYLAGTGRFTDREQYPMPCLVLLDLKLPGKSGLEVLAWIRQQPDLKRLVVIVFTSSALPADVNRAYDLGANSFIVKPVQFQATTVLIERLRDYWLKLNQFSQIQP